MLFERAGRHRQHDQPFAGASVLCLRGLFLRSWEQQGGRVDLAHGVVGDRRHRHRDLLVARTDQEHQDQLLHGLTRDDGTQRAVPGGDGHRAAW